MWKGAAGNWWPVATIAASATWAAAVEAESAALGLAFCLLRLSSHVSLHALFATVGAVWGTAAAADDLLGGVLPTVAPTDFCRLVGAESLPGCWAA